MVERTLPVYHFLVIDARKQTTQRQVNAYVAAPSAKRAAELFKVTPRDIATHGDTTGQRPVQEMCRAEPEQVFLEGVHGTFYRFDDYLDAAKAIVLDMRDEEIFGRSIESAAFGQVSVSRVSGERALFMVDYPQDHYLTLSIHKASLNRNLASDRVSQGDEIIEIAMSEVQWARLLSSPNTQGAPCTLNHYVDPKSGDFMTPQMPLKHAADVETFTSEIRERTSKAASGVAEARARLAEILKGPLRKSDLAELSNMLRDAEGQMTNGLEYVVKRADETIKDSAAHAKAEVDAHIDYAMARLGERALGARLQAAIDDGADIAQLGRGIAVALDDKREDAG